MTDGSGPLLEVLIPIRSAMNAQAKQGSREAVGHACDLLAGLERASRKSQPLLQDPSQVDSELGRDRLDVICMRFLAIGVTPFVPERLDLMGTIRPSSPGRSHAGRCRGTGHRPGHVFSLLDGGPVGCIGSLQLALPR